MIQLSIIICTYNRDKFLPVALKSLRGQSLETEKFEIIVVNNNSRDNTQEICENFMNDNPELNFHVVIEKQQGLSYARNRGIEEARGEFISYIDDDAIADKDYAKNIVYAFNEYKDFDALGGKVIPIYETGNEPKWLSKYAWGMVSKIDYGDLIKPFSHKYPAGCNMVFRKKVFKVIGDFNTDLANRCDDRYIFHQMKVKRKKTLYHPKIKVNHFIPESRITDEGVKKIATISGSEYRILLRKESLFETTLKAVDYLMKIVAAIVLSLGFVLKGQPAKAKLVKIMYYSLLGYLKA